MINKHWDLTTYSWEEPGQTHQDYGTEDIFDPANPESMR